MPNAILNINYAKVQDIQNSSDLLTVVSTGLIQKDDVSITPAVLSQYFLYNRSFGQVNNFGLNNESYLNYTGGFLTVENKINTKYSDFSIEKNLTVNLSSTFVKGFDMRNINGVNTNRIVNVKSINNVKDLISKNFDNEAITINAFKTLSYARGMIMMWAGSYEDLRKHLPYWRLCAPPDSGSNIGGVFVPNLQGKFIMGGSYMGSASSYDNFNPPRLTSIPTVIGTEGGQNRITLEISNLPPHTHSYNIATSGGVTSIFTSEGLPTTFYTDGGGITGLTRQIYIGGRYRGRFRTVSNLKSHSGGSATDDFNTTALTSDGVIGYISRNPFFFTTIGNTHEPIVVERLTTSEDENRGGGKSHENRPPYYALAYIIYVGVKR
jgi:microcystin-dependent protein